MMSPTAIHPLKILAALGAALFVWALLLAYASSPAWASTITVNSLADKTTNNGKCTLREAITAANTDTASGAAAGECAAGEATGSDLIDIQGLSGTVQLTGGLPDIKTNMDLVGPGADRFTVRRDTGGDYTIFTVLDPAEVSITGMTITNANTTNDAGAIYNGGSTLTVKESTISANTTSRDGAGIYNGGGTLTVKESTISANTSGGDGAGIYNNFGTLKVERTTVSGNTAADAGGGIRSDTDLDGPITTTITNSTISGNSATTKGGGVYNHGGLSVIKHSTITKNSAPTDSGSGVASYGDTLTSTQVISSIISANTNTDVDFVSDPTNSFDSEGYNLIGDGNAAEDDDPNTPVIESNAFNQTGDQTGVSDPKLDPLDSYGGPTQTHRLQSDSPAIDAGPPTNGDPIACPPPATDQRGVTRPQDGDADATAGCDIGSFELDVVHPQVSNTSPNKGVMGVAPSANVSATFSEPMNANTITRSTFKLTKVADGSKVTASISYDDASQQATLDPANDLGSGQYKAVVTTGAQDLAGNPLDQKPSKAGNQRKSWKFTVS